MLELDMLIEILVNKKLFCFQSINLNIREKN